LFTGVIHILALIKKKAQHLLVKAVEGKRIKVYYQLLYLLNMFLLQFQRQKGFMIFLKTCSFNALINSCKAKTNNAPWFVFKILKKETSR
jgi:hypothetical protein